MAHRFAERFMGWLSLTLLELNVMSLYQRSMMFCNEWSVHPLTQCALFKRGLSCGVPLFANTPKSSCKHCGKQVDLSINPKLVGVSLKRFMRVKLILKSVLLGWYSDRRDWQHHLW